MTESYNVAAFSQEDSVSGCAWLASPYKLLGRSGSFWQREYFDHLIRGEGSLAGIVQYVRNNPKCGITELAVGGKCLGGRMPAPDREGHTKKGAGWKPALQKQACTPVRLSELDLAAKSNDPERTIFKWSGALSRTALEQQEKTLRSSATTSGDLSYKL